MMKNKIKETRMKDFIEKSNLTATQFAKKYGIPYNTVWQWAEGIRKAPAWLKKLFEAEQAYKPLIPLIEEKEEVNNDLENYLVVIRNIKTNTKIHYRMITYKEYLRFEESYWYIEYVKKDKRNKIDYYLLKKI